MKVKTKKISDLKPATYNPRSLSKKQEKDLTESLKGFGIVDPILINSNPERENVIIGGHQRVKCWYKLGNKTIPVLELNLSIEQEKELNVRLNKNTGEFDNELLKEYFEDKDLIEFGFEPFEIGVMDEENYEVPDDENPKFEDEKTDIKKSLKIEFDKKDFKKANEFLSYWKTKKANIGAMFLESMREKQNQIMNEI